MNSSWFGKVSLNFDRTLDLTESMGMSYDHILGGVSLQHMNSPHEVYFPLEAVCVYNGALPIVPILRKKKKRLTVKIESLRFDCDRRGTY